MNEIIKSLSERKSVRSFLQKDIDEETKALILKSACEAPTAGNQQLYTIIDITTQELKDKLAKSCDNQPFIAKAPMVVIFCADPLKWDRAYRSIGLEPRKLGAGDMILAVQDAMIAAQNAVVAAESLGLGSCYIGDILENREYHKDLLKLPDGVIPVGMLVIGYPTKQAAEREKPPRSPMEHIVHTDFYREMGSDELKAMLLCKARGQEYEQWLTAFCKRKYESDFSLEMTRSVEEYIKEFE